MGRHAVIVVAVALLLAGCVGGQGGTATTTAPEPSDAGTTTAETTDGATSDGTSGGATDGTATGDGTSAMHFYVSDERNAMGDFAHLNVTISKVGMKRAGGGNANWTTYEVDDRTVDLTRLRGANATRLGTFAVRNGTYETVFVHVSEVNGTLANGEQVRVKLPSDKLQIHQTFEVGPNQSIDYVFDVSVFEAGKSGKYILKPVISESGTDKEIEAVGEEEKGGPDGKRSKGNEKRDDEETENETDADGTESETTDAALNATFVGNVTRGGNATVAVARNGTAVANATVGVNGEVVGETDANGTATFSVPDEAELEVEIQTENGSVELKRRFENSDEGNGNGGGN